MLNFEEEFLRIYPKQKSLLQAMKDALETNEITWDMLTLRNLGVIRDHLSATHAPNTAVTLCAIIKAFLAQFTDTGWMPCGKEYGNALRTKRSISEHVVLSEEEIERIENYSPKTKGEADVKAQFLCEYYSLARSSDIKAFTAENIDETNGVITYVSQKTKKSAKVPIHRNFMKYFRQRGTARTRWFYNYTIKKICRACGIIKPTKLFYRGKIQTVEKCELVGSHTARRSGATNLAKRGVPISVIALMMGHGQDLQMTQRYIWIKDLEMTKELEGFFK